MDKPHLTLSAQSDAVGRLADMAILDNIFRARSVALIGASTNQHKAASLPLRILKQTGFAGEIYPVNPAHAEIDGLRCFPDIASLPETPDVAAIMVAARDVPDTIAQCARRGIRAAIAFSSGFEETEGGRSLADELRRAAREGGVAVMGPNCMGMWSVQSRVILTFAVVALRSNLRHAPIAMLTQSGAMGNAIARHLQDHGSGCAYVVSAGNETVLGILDYLAWMIEQNDVQVVLLFIEGLRDGARLLRLAERARERGVQLVALKSGNSAAGREATASHTGKMAAPHAIYRDIFEQAGIIQVSSLTALIEIAGILTSVSVPRSAGQQGGVSICATSGGAGALLADLCEQHGVPLAVLQEQTLSELTAVLPPFGHAGNPTDLTGQIRSDPTLFAKGLGIMAKDPHTEALVVQWASGGEHDTAEQREVLKLTARNGVTPIFLSFAANRLSAEKERDLLDAGIRCSPDPADTARYLGWLYARRQFSLRGQTERLPTAPKRAAPRSWRGIMEFLDDAGIAALPWRSLRPNETPEDACQGLRFPVALKASPFDAAHKTDRGLVILGIPSARELAAQGEIIRQRMNKPAAELLVQEMAPEGIEVVLSAIRNPDFGPILALGAGGVAIELFGDIGYLALPADRNDILRLLRRLKLWSLLQGFRGRPRADIEALVAAALGLATNFFACPDLAEIEINPLFVLPENMGVVAVDALVKAVER